MPNLPVARVMWKPMPSLEEAGEAWILAGGAHHSVISYTVTAEQLRDWANMMGIEFVHITKDLDMDKFKDQLMLSDKNFSVRELAAIASGYTRILQGSANTLKDLQGIINPSDLSMTDKDRLDVVDKTYAELLRLRNLTSYYTRQNLSVSYIRARKSNDMERTLSLYGTDEDKYW